jgi:hypothetical protein
VWQARMLTHADAHCEEKKTKAHVRITKQMMKNSRKMHPAYAEQTHLGLGSSWQTNSKASEWQRYITKLQSAEGANALLFIGCHLQENDGLRAVENFRYISAGHASDRTSHHVTIEKRLHSRKCDYAVSI